MGKIPRSRSRVLGQLLEKVRPNVPERSKSASRTESKPMTPKKKSFTSHQMHIDRLEAHIKEKLHDMMCRRQSTPQSSKSDPETDRKELTKSDSIKTKRIMYKKIGKSCDKICSTTSSKSDTESCNKNRNKSDPDYQRISDATSHSVKALIHKETRSSPASPKKPKAPMNKHSATPKKPKVYPYSDGEDNVFYSLNDSADSLSTSSRRSSFDGPDKTLVVVINRRNKGMSAAQKQRSWETFPPKRRHHMCHKLSAPNPMPLRKADSFEGHEEAVKSLVAAVQETRRKPKTGGN